jgi:hypothetical protein
MSHFRPPRRTPLPCSFNRLSLSLLEKRDFDFDQISSGVSMMAKSPSQRSRRLVPRRTRAVGSGVTSTIQGRRTVRQRRNVHREGDEDVFSNDNAPHSVSGTRGIAVNLRQCLVLIATLWPVSAFSAAGDTFFTGDMLHRYCNQSSESCTNYIAGVVDALIAVGATQKTPLICLHDRTELGQAVDVIANYLRTHPEKRHGNAAGIAITALRHAFPCSSHQRPPR